MSRPLPGCTHGISDDVVLSFRHVVEDFFRGTKVTVLGYECPEHGRHGTHTVHEATRKTEAPARAEPA